MRLFWWWPFGKVPEITAQELLLKLREENPGLQLIDVRTVSEWEGSHIANTLNVPVTEFRSKLSDLNLDKDRPVVAMCRAARRSILAVRVLQDSGFKQVCHLQGGMRAWWRAGFPVIGSNPDVTASK